MLHHTEPNAGLLTSRSELMLGTLGALFGALVLALSIHLLFQPNPNISVVATKVFFLPVLAWFGVRIGTRGFLLARRVARATDAPISSDRSHITVIALEDHRYRKPPVHRSVGYSTTHHVRVVAKHPSRRMHG